MCVDSVSPHVMSAVWPGGGGQIWCLDLHTNTVTLKHAHTTDCVEDSLIWIDLSVLFKTRFSSVATTFIQCMFLKASCQFIKLTSFVYHLDCCSMVVCGHTDMTHNDSATWFSWAVFRPELRKTSLKLGGVFFTSRTVLYLYSTFTILGTNLHFECFQEIIISKPSAQIVWKQCGCLVQDLTLSLSSPNLANHWLGVDYSLSQGNVEIIFKLFP